MIKRIFLVHLELQVRNNRDLLRRKSKNIFRETHSKILPIFNIKVLTLTLPSLAPVANLLPSGENAIDHASAGPPSIHFISVPS